MGKKNNSVSLGDKAIIEERATLELIPNARNARTHPKPQIKKIAASIKEFGFLNPIVIDADGGVLAGHGRLEAAKLMGLELCQTYARQPDFYGATFCCGCGKHLPVAEFVWSEDGQRVGS